MQLPFGLDLVSFMAGAVLVLVVAFLVFLLNIWWVNATTPFRPQVVVQATKKTPWQVVFSAFGTIFQYVGLALVVSAIVLIVFFHIAPRDVSVLALVGVITLIVGTVMRAIAK